MGYTRISRRNRRISPTRPVTRTRPPATIPSAARPRARIGLGTPPHERGDHQARQVRQRPGDAQVGVNARPVLDEHGGPGEHHPDGRGGLFEHEFDLGRELGGERRAVVHPALDDGEDRRGEAALDEPPEPDGRRVVRMAGSRRMDWRSRHPPIVGARVKRGVT